MSHPASDDASIHLADTRSTRGRMSDDADETRLLFGVDDDDEGEGQEGEGARNSDSSASKHSLDQDRDRDRDRDHDGCDSNGHLRMIRMGHARARVSRVDVSLPSSPVSGVHSAGERGGGHVLTAPTVSKENTNGLGAQAGAIIVRRLLRLS